MDGGTLSNEPENGLVATQSLAALRYNGPRLFDPLRIGPAHERFQQEGE
jgi:hypothetical protein